MTAMAGCSSGSGGTTVDSSTTVIANHIPPATSPGAVIKPSGHPLAPADAWAVDTSHCADNSGVSAPITGSLVIGSVAPQSGGLISTIYAPVVAGFQAYVDHANAAGLVPGVKLGVVVADDQGDPTLTPVAVNGLLAAGAQVVSGIIGTANNLAVRTVLNNDCVPQLMALSNSPRLGDVTAAPWTMGGLVPVTVEATVYANTVARLNGSDARVALLVSDDDSGSAMADAFVSAAFDANLTVVERETVPAASVVPPDEAVLLIAAKQPDVIVASLVGAACATFLSQLGVVRASIEGWHPTVYVSSGCADESILGLAGTAADGVLSATNLVNGEPTFDAAMKAAGVTADFGAAAEGWTAAEVTVAILRQAQQSTAGLTRASIIDAARNLAFVPSLARPGVQYTTNGLDDAYPAESLQVIKFDAASRSFSDVGPLVAQFES